MYQDHSRFELFVELIMQVKYGNCYYSGLKKCTRLSRNMLDQTIAPLLYEGLLRRVKIEDGQDDQICFRVTDRGEQFIDFFRMAFNFVELSSDN